jgi:Histidine kinase/Histidine kinase-, DNA gyrase B-, and HSP90-like ATPase
MGLDLPSGRAPFVSLPIAHPLVVNDPESVPAGASWMQGITPARLGILAALCFTNAAAVHAWNFVYLGFFVAFERFLNTSGAHFIAALPMFVLVVKTEIWTARSSPRFRVGALILAVVVGTASYVALRHGVRFGAPVFGIPWHYSISLIFRGLILGGLLTAILFFMSRERDAQRRYHRERLARVAIEKQIVESRLQLLQAQIEPHFLFNSLASVKRLYEREPDKGRALLRGLTDYLRAATNQAKERENRLDREVALAQSFLGIFQVRMGARLRVAVDVPAELDAAMVPSLMLGTLVENAIKHGIGPRASGGTLSVTARRHGGDLEFSVADDGVGFHGRCGYGIGLDNIQARLETLHGGDARLDLVNNSQGGVTASIRLPYRLAAEAPRLP